MIPEDPNVLEKDLPPFLAHSLSLDVLEGVAEFWIILSPDLVPIWAGISPRLDDRLCCASTQMRLYHIAWIPIQRINLWISGSDIGKRFGPDGEFAPHPRPLLLPIGKVFLPPFRVPLDTRVNLGPLFVLLAQQTQLTIPRDLADRGGFWRTCWNFGHFSMPQESVFKFRVLVCLLFPRLGTNGNL